MSCSIARPRGVLLSCRKERSILTVSKSVMRSHDRPAKPVPKSSSQILMPSVFRSFRQRSTSECISMSRPSVISKASLLPAIPASTRMAATDVANPGFFNCMGDTLTLTTSTLSSANMCLQTVLMVHRPSSMIVPVRSAIGMKMLGATELPSSRRSRISASTPVVSLVEMFKIGW